MEFKKALGEIGETPTDEEVDAAFDEVDRSVLSKCLSVEILQFLLWRCGSRVTHATKEEEEPRAQFLLSVHC